MELRFLSTSNVHAITEGYASEATKVVIVVDDFEGIVIIKISFIYNSTTQKATTVISRMFHPIWHCVNEFLCIYLWIDLQV